MYIFRKTAILYIVQKGYIFYFSLSLCSPITLLLKLTNILAIYNLRDLEKENTVNFDHIIEYVLFIFFQF